MSNRSKKVGWKNIVSEMKSAVKCNSRIGIQFSIAYKKDSEALKISVCNDTVKNPPKLHQQDSEKTICSVPKCDGGQVLSLGEMERIDLDDLELPLPDLLSPSDILSEEHIRELFPLLPARAVGYPWTRIFSTSFDGFHLKTLYRKMSDFDCPVILALQDDQGAVFGALLPVPLKASDSFYGTGESFLFTFYPSFKVFRWTGVNDYFVRGNSDSISIGASEGHFGLYFDGDLYRGSSVRCQTYDNDTLAASSDFIIQTLEAWGFS